MLDPSSVFGFVECEAGVGLRAAQGWMPQFGAPRWAQLGLATGIDTLVGQDRFSLSHKGPASQGVT